MYSQVHMGGRVDITLYAESEDTAEAAARAGFATFARLEDVFSDYRPSSELMRLCAQAGMGPVVVSPVLFSVLSYAYGLSELTGGAFDVTASPVIRLWRAARASGKLPSGYERAQALSLIGWRKMHLDPLLSTVALDVPGMQLDLGGIAKGFTAEAAVRALGSTSAMVEAGGDIFVSGPPPGALGWSIKIRGVDDLFYIRDTGLSTSGDTEQFVDIEGVRYSHVVDPRTGLGVTNRVQASVFSGCGMSSDSCATALCVDPTLAEKLEEFVDGKAIVTVVS